MDGKCVRIGENRKIGRPLVGQTEKIDHLEDTDAHGK